ncbi:mucin-binding protein [Streptococcus pacificus]|uniref:KxYKxGKxW signal peptide domain-containing protein n=1 Tax=Streptococcus pacificus TaxID=2740577 RepID=A0ABS0ZGS3_9STRE|nr:KxYKxGKxW signal peptide domain-containing protein [Streptococcus pacificus]MBJ8325212.1 KxYKxGKxW signal peptide domain-containing protein [Streptococcus pacificus]
MKKPTDAKITRFRMWKKGKQWLFGASLLSAFFLTANVQAFAQENQKENAAAEINLLQDIPDSQPATINTPIEISTGEESIKVVEENDDKTGTLPDSEKLSTSELTPAVDGLNQEDNKQKLDQKAVTTENSPQTNSVSDTMSEDLLGDSDKPTSEFNDHLEDQFSVDTIIPVNASEKLDVSTPKAVNIYYDTDQSDGGSYYLHLWDTGQTEVDFTPMSSSIVDGKKRWHYAVNVAQDKSVFKYIIVRDRDWDQKKTQDMAAPVNTITETNIYHSNDYYSHFMNVQSEEFDKKFGYKDKVVDGDSEDGFQTVGKWGRLGATKNEDGTATINLWAPTAQEVTLNLYESVAKNASLDKTIIMQRGSDFNENDHTQNTVGVWTTTISKEEYDRLNKNGKGVAYDFSLTIPNAYFIQKSAYMKKGNDGNYYIDHYIYRNSATKEVINDQANDNASREQIAAFYLGRTDGNVGAISEQITRTVKTQDPYSQAVVQDGSRSVIIASSDLGDKVAITQNKRVTSNTQISVLEVDVRDFSIDESSGVDEKDRGNFLGMVQSGTTNASNGNHMTGIDYLNYLGVNYVQIMPIYDFQTVPELDKDDPENITISPKEDHGVHNNQQNWGYDPKNYNVPDGSYSTDPADPLVRIKEAKEMVQKLHDAGINVVMDVVYNHLYDGQENPFEWTVPGYFYAVMPDGAMNNDVGVGNAVRSNSEMMRQYIVNSVIYWAKEYGMDGFRFDAMSDLDVNTLNLVRDAINKIDPKIVTYGEGWDSMGKYLAKDGETPGSDKNAKQTPTYGFFDSIGRDAIAGSHYDNGNPPGFVNRHSDYKTNSNNLSRLVDSMLGGHGRHFGSASQQLNYVEVHDGMTLSDLLKHYNPEDTAEEHQKRVELASAMSALSQGIHFSQIGQEFLKSKEKSHNTYNGGDELNRIQWGLVKDNVDVVNFYKSIVALRKNESLLHLSDYQKEVFPHMVITNVQVNSGIITYELKKDNGDKYLMVFNNNTDTSNPSLILGGDNWYYGRTGAGNGVINSGDKRNDFSNAYIVTTNSENLYDKIGQFNGEKTIKFNPLSASVLYIPAKEETELITKQQTINYVDTKGTKKADSNVQKVTYLTIKFHDPNSKFTYTKSEIETKADDLGHLKNVLDTSTNEIETVVKTYYATNEAGDIIEVTELPAIENGKPKDTATIKWIEATAQTKLITHPVIAGYRVISNTDASNDLVQTPSHSLQKEASNQTITVTYAKETKAVIVSENDPEKRLPISINDLESKTNLIFEGVSGDTINWKNVDLTREGYSFTVNHQASLDLAVKAINNGHLGDEDIIYTVVYTANPAKISIRYVDNDDNDKVVKTETLDGVTNQVASFTFEVPAGYEKVSDNAATIKSFDTLDDSATASQVVTVALRHKHEKSTYETVNTVTYIGAGESTPAQATVKVTWAVDKDLVTQISNYTAVEKTQTVTSPAISGYEANKSSVVFSNTATTSQPANQEATVTYTENKPAPETKVPDTYPVVEDKVSDFVPETKVPDTYPVVEDKLSDFVPETKVPDSYPVVEDKVSDFVPETKVPDTYPVVEDKVSDFVPETKVPDTYPVVEDKVSDFVPETKVPDTYPVVEDKVSDFVPETKVFDTHPRVKDKDSNLMSKPIVSITKKTVEQTSHTPYSRVLKHQELPMTGDNDDSNRVIVGHVLVTLTMTGLIFFRRRKSNQ